MLSPSSRVAVRASGLGWLLAAALAFPCVSAEGQEVGDSLAPVAVGDSAIAASLRGPPRPSPLGALWRSFLIPGWGQAIFERKLTGGVFLAWEGVTLGMTLKTRHELAYLRRTNSGRGNSKRQEHEDWLVLLVFNHLFAGLEAYVSAHLADFPDDLEIRAVPGGVAGTLPLPFRVR